MREKGRAGVYLIAGFYLLYNAYQVFGFRNDNQGEEKTLMIIFSIVFLIAGLGLTIASFYIMKKVREKERQQLEAQKALENTEKEREKV